MPPRRVNLQERFEALHAALAEHEAETATVAEQVARERVARATEALAAQGAAAAAAAGAGHA